jgi:hypothetical protein
MARTAVIAGTATHVSNNVSRRQANKWASQDQQQYAQQQYAEPQYAAPPPPAAPAGGDTDDKIEQLKKLADLHSQGILTDDEFASEKAKILG